MAAAVTIEKVGSAPLSIGEGSDVASLASWTPRESLQAWGLPDSTCTTPTGSAVDAPLLLEAAVRSDDAGAPVSGAKARASPTLVSAFAAAASSPFDQPSGSPSAVASSPFALASVQRDGSADETAPLARGFDSSSSHGALALEITAAAAAGGGGGMSPRLNGGGEAGRPSRRDTRTDLEAAGGGSSGGGGGGGGSGEDQPLQPDGSGSKTRAVVLPGEGAWEAVSRGAEAAHWWEGPCARACTVACLPACLPCPSPSPAGPCLPPPGGITTRERNYMVAIFTLVASLLFADQNLMAPNLTAIANGVRRGGRGEARECFACLPASSCRDCRLSLRTPSLLPFPPSVPPPPPRPCQILGLTRTSVTNILEATLPLVRRRGVEGGQGGGGRC